MPPKSPFIIRLSDEEHSELVRRSRQYTPPYRDVTQQKFPQPSRVNKNTSP